MQMFTGGENQILAKHQSLSLFQMLPGAGQPVMMACTTKEVQDRFTHTHQQFLLLFHTAVVLTGGI
jgi:hypothetical protein